MSDDTGRARILVVEDEPHLFRTLSRILERRGWAVEAAGHGLEALARLDDGPFDILLTDLNMPAMDGMSLLRKLQERDTRPSIVVLTGYGTIQTAVEAMKLGAADYLIKPCDPEELILVIDRLLELRDLRGEVASLRREVHATHRHYGSLIGDAPAMREVYRLIDAVSGNRSTVLVTGPSGTGKELVARTLHARSPWSRAPFVAMNCGAVSETLLDSQLFGHRRGAFTGAIADQQGVFQAADGGTLFLDEVSEIPLALQVKFLRAIQEREVTPLGSTRSVKIDVRLVAATNRDLRGEIRSGRFREDLFYRLNVVNIDLPPLAERREDIPALVAHFVGEFARQYGVSAKRVTRETMERLLAHSWPGNVRELRNAIERAFAVSTAETIELADVAPGLDDGLAGGSGLQPRNEARRRGTAATGRTAATPSPERGGEAAGANVSLEEIERQAIERALLEAGGNKNEAARMLGIDRQRLYRKIEKHGLGTGRG